MNVFVLELASTKTGAEPDISPRKLVVEDNVGESIHLHLRNTRVEFTVDDFDELATNLIVARENIENGNS